MQTVSQYADEYPQEIDQLYPTSRSENTWTEFKYLDFYELIHPSGDEFPLQRSPTYSKIFQDRYLSRKPREIRITCPSMIQLNDSTRIYSVCVDPVDPLPYFGEKTVVVLLFQQIDPQTGGWASPRFLEINGEWRRPLPPAAITLFEGKNEAGDTVALYNRLSRFESGLDYGLTWWIRVDSVNPVPSCTLRKVGGVSEDTSKDIYFDFVVRQGGESGTEKTNPGYFYPPYIQSGGNYAFLQFYIPDGKMQTLDVEPPPKKSFPDIRFLSNLLIYNDVLGGRVWLGIANMRFNRVLQREETYDAKFPFEELKKKLHQFLTDEGAVNRFQETKHQDYGTDNRGRPRLPLASFPMFYTIIENPYTKDLYILVSNPFLPIDRKALTAQDHSRVKKDRIFSECKAVSLTFKDQTKQDIIVSFDLGGFYAIQLNFRIGDVLSRTVKSLVSYTSDEYTIALFTIGNRQSLSYSLGIFNPYRLPSGTHVLLVQDDYSVKVVETKSGRVAGPFSLQKIKSLFYSKS